MGNIYSRKLLPFDVMRLGIDIHECKMNQLGVAADQNLEKWEEEGLIVQGVPLKYKIMKEMLWVCLI